MCQFMCHISIPMLCLHSCPLCLDSYPLHRQAHVKVGVWQARSSIYVQPHVSTSFRAYSGILCVCVRVCALRAPIIVLVSLHSFRCPPSLLPRSLSLFSPVFIPSLTPSTHSTHIDTRHDRRQQQQRADDARGATTSSHEHAGCHTAFYSASITACA